VSFVSTYPILASVRVFQTLVDSYEVAETLGPIIVCFNTKIGGYRPWGWQFHCVGYAEKQQRALPYTFRYLRTERKGRERQGGGKFNTNFLLLKIIDAEVMIGDEGFTQWGGEARVKTQCFY